MAYYAGYTNGEPVEALLNRSVKSGYSAYKAKSDCVREAAVEAIFRWLAEEEVLVFMDPLGGGGRMDEVVEAEIPFPHRVGSHYNIQYVVVVGESGREDSKRPVEWLKRFYEYMGGFISKGPRRAYLNYRDLDLGWNKEGNGTSFEEGEVWGRKYFVGNYERLALVKGEVNPGYFFKNEQSIPPLFAK
ncbi:Cannabidiolic acid synthase [Acorus calamus]|uniref:Cannabidiolic acid synthase n=1 Tax=Acorus calamus TaxID=4465 RepID=A0AAV9C4T6_ACOCL|nr:Cannabidiolic acid synthase [Acorus calamus]